MFPVLFKLSFAEIQTYYVVWISALFIFIYWTRRRAETVWGLDYDGVTRALAWIYFAGVLGAVAASAAERLPLYFEGGASLKNAMSGLSSGGGMAAAGAVGIWRLRKENINVESFADAAAIPASVMLCVGRVGCFCAGCCAGVGKFYETPAPFWALHFPFDEAGFYRFPSQLAESAFALLLALFLLLVEAALRRGERPAKFAFLMPLFMICYSSYRLFSDRYRDLSYTVYRHTGNGGLIWKAAVILGVLWLAASLARALKQKKRATSKER